MASQRAEKSDKASPPGARDDAFSDMSPFTSGSSVRS
jgi:hypothetical protein